MRVGGMLAFLEKKRQQRSTIKREFYWCEVECEIREECSMIVTEGTCVFLREISRVMFVKVQFA